MTAHPPRRSPFPVLDAVEDVRAAMDRLVTESVGLLAAAETLAALRDQMGRIEAKVDRLSESTLRLVQPGMMPTEEDLRTIRPGSVTLSRADAWGLPVPNPEPYAVDVEIVEPTAPAEEPSERAVGVDRDAPLADWILAEFKAAGPAGLTSAEAADRVIAAGNPSTRGSAQVTVSVLRRRGQLVEIGSRIVRGQQVRVLAHRDYLAPAADVEPAEPEQQEEGGEAEAAQEAPPIIHEPIHEAPAEPEAPRQVVAIEPQRTATWARDYLRRRGWSVSPANSQETLWIVGTLTMTTDAMIDKASRMHDREHPTA